jgi:hypothetical protein
MTHRPTDAPVERASSLSTQENAPLVDLASSDTNSSIKQMSPQSTSNDDWFKFWDNEKERNKEGRPDPYAFTDKAALDKQLEDTEGLSKKLTDNFDRWDLNHDGVLAPSELEDIYTNESTSAEDKTATAALRLKYGQFADLSLPNMHSESSTITKSDLDVLGVIYNEDKKDAAFEQFYKAKEEAAYEKLGDANFLVDAFMWGAGVYEKYFGLPGEFDDMVNQERQNLESKPVKESGLPLCLPDSVGSCSLY